MTKYINSFIFHMKSAFKYKTTFAWFVIAFIGFIIRYDHLGVTSIVRALMLPHNCYPNLLHFFHSNAWSLKSLLQTWIRWLVIENLAYRVNKRIVILGDHTKAPKDGRKIPEVTTLHQNSETATKPSFFRGHEWGCIALLTKASSKFFATPLKAEIHNTNYGSGSRIDRIVNMAGEAMELFGAKAYLVLDAYFAAGTTFSAARQFGDKLHILTRAKKNITAYIPADKPINKKRGRFKLYGEKLKLMEIFDSWTNLFLTDSIRVYQEIENVRYLSLDLMWKPTKGLIRFFLFETSRGRIILMTSDLNMSHTVAMKLYCRRFSIEIFFDVLKNVFGGLQYHFWSKYLTPASRKPKRGNQLTQFSLNPTMTKVTQHAIEKFVAIQLITIGFLQCLACKFPTLVCETALCYLRTTCSNIPSEFVTKIAVTNTLQKNLAGFGNNPITHFILEKRKTPGNTGFLRKAG